MKKRCSKALLLLREYLVEILSFTFGIAAVNAIFIAKAFRQSRTVDPALAGQLGSFVGGYVGPVLSLIGVLLLYATLKNQRLASARQNFETKYFELLQMHRANISELEVQGNSGRRVFVLVFREFRAALQIAKKIAAERQQIFDDRRLLTVAYYCTFYGVGPTSSRMLKMSLSMFDAEFIDEIEKELNRRETKERVMTDSYLTYLPFDGHQSRLGHYYRHLYQMVRYVHDQPPEMKIDKYEHIKTIRAQLSTYEQALLLVNSLTPVGRNWWAKGLIEEYRLVKNIPRDFFNPKTEIDADSLFERGYFEWEE